MIRDARPPKMSYLCPKCFGPVIRRVEIPKTMSSVSKTVNKYSGVANPETWITDYYFTVEIHGGTLEAVRL